jgi:uncharacterized protein YndB with AHSA1/START domain
MNTLHFSTIIDADRETVWNAMIAPERTRRSTSTRKRTGGELS